MASAAGLTGLAGGFGGVELDRSTAAEAARGIAVGAVSVEEPELLTNLAHGAFSVAGRFPDDDDADDRCTAEAELLLAAPT